MVTDLFLGWILGAVETVVGLLPTATLGTLPALTEFMGWVSDVNTLIPVAPLLQTFVVIISGLVIFVVVRVVLLVWNLIWP